MTTSRQTRKGAFEAHPSLARRVALKRFFARLVLFTERSLPLLLAPLAVAALFFAVAWFGIFRILPDWLRLASVFALTLAFIASLSPFRRLRWPRPQDADRMLEARNNLPHQPVGVQEDEPAFDTPFARALWKQHQIRMAEKIAALDAGLPQPDISRHDRFALRSVPALLLFAAFGFSFSNGSGTVEDAFRAQPAAGPVNPDLRVDAWVTPPSYTARPPVYLTGRNAGDDNGTIAIPQNSELTIRITGGAGAETVLYHPGSTSEPRPLAIDTGAEKGQPATGNGQIATLPPLQPLAARTYLLKLEENADVSVNGERWTFDVIADKAPEIAFENQPRRSANGSLEIAFTARDDYGIRQANALIEPVATADTGATPLYPAPDYKLDLPRQNSRESKGVTSRNLTEHPLAGKRVRITLVATDGAGQTGKSPPQEIILPDRGFSEPLAAAVAEQRQVFALDTRQMPQSIALNDALTVRADETITNSTHFLLIRSALARMQLAYNEDTLKDTANYLWEIALGIEDGDLSLAERRLRDAQKQLADALSRNAPDEEIKKLMDELRKAMQDFMSELAERMQNSPQANQNQQAQNVLRQRDLQNMLDQIENLARSGNRDAAQEMLSQLQRMMNNLQAGRQPRSGEGQQQNSQLRQQIDKLGELMQEQQKLMDQTFRLDQALRDRMQRGDPGENGDEQQQGDRQEGQQGQQSQQGDGQQEGQPSDRMTAEQLREALKQLRAQQEGLGKKLEELQKGLADMGMKPGQGFGEAEREMKGAGEALGQSQGERAVEGQGKALNALRQGAQDMMGQIMQAMRQQGQGQGQGEGMAPQGGQNGRDPLGRPRSTSGPDFGDQVKVPDEIDVQRAREILDAIRDKLGVGGGAEVERNYLERLLDIR